MNSGYRKAALHLYGLSELDRHWIMDRLSIEQSRRLEKLIGELIDMGIPADQPWLADLPSDPLTQAQTQTQECSPVQYAELEIESAEFTLLKSVLDNEPASVVALILSYRDWSWRGMYFQQCEPVRRQRIAERQASDDRMVTTKVLEALIVGLAEKLSDPEKQQQESMRQLKISGCESDRGHWFWRLLWQR